MTFQFYIFTFFDGSVKGTNSQEEALNFAECEDFIVIEPGKNLWHRSSSDAKEITESFKA